MKMGEEREEGAFKPGCLGVGQKELLNSGTIYRNREVRK